MKVNVKFFWRKSVKVWPVCGNDIEEIVRRAEVLCYKYRAKRFEVQC